MRNKDVFYRVSTQQKTTQKCVVLRKPWLLCILITVNSFRNATIFPALHTRCTTQENASVFRTPPQSGGVLPSTVFRDSKRRRKNASSFAGAENRTRTGTDVTPRDFKSLASAYSATSASLEASPGIEPGMKALQASALPLGYGAESNAAHQSYSVFWSGLRGSNSLPPPWQGGALPDELNPHKSGGPGRNRTNDTRIFSPLLYRLSYKGTFGDPDGARTHDL